ncbi:transposase [Streptomyces sp. NBC_01589]|uniref:transposase n=1 Tax=unclassified Streptomyces TaxID=2593676 RepID=UPI0038640FDB
MLGHCLIDGDLYVQEHWTKDTQRCEQAGLGRDFTFRTKTAITLEQAQRAVADGVAVDWAAGDETSDAEDLSSGLGELYV